MCFLTGLFNWVVFVFTYFEYLTLPLLVTIMLHLVNRQLSFLWKGKTNTSNWFKICEPAVIQTRSQKYNRKQKYFWLCANRTDSNVIKVKGFPGWNNKSRGFFGYSPYPWNSFRVCVRLSEAFLDVLSWQLLLHMHLVLVGRNLGPVYLYIGEWEPITSWHSSCMWRHMLTLGVNRRALSCPLVTGSLRTDFKTRCKQGQQSPLLLPSSLQICINNFPENHQRSHY